MLWMANGFCELPFGTAAKARARTKTSTNNLLYPFTCIPSFENASHIQGKVLLPDRQDTKTLLRALQAQSLQRWLVLERGFDETAEERVRSVGFGKKLGVKLAGDEPRMIAQFDQFDAIVLAVNAGNRQARLHQLIAVGVVDFVPVTMAFADFIAAVQFSRLRAGDELRSLSAQPHRAAFGLDAFLFF